MRSLDGRGEEKIKSAHSDLIPVNQVVLVGFGMLSTQSPRDKFCLSADFTSPAMSKYSDPLLTLNKSTITTLWKYSTTITSPAFKTSLK